MDNSFNLFVGENYKYLGLVLGYDDYTLQFYFFISPIMSMCGNQLCTKVFVN